MELYEDISHVIDLFFYLKIDLANPYQLAIIKLWFKNELIKVRLLVASVYGTGLASKCFTFLDAFW